MVEIKALIETKSKWNTLFVFWLRENKHVKVSTVFYGVSKNRSRHDDFEVALIHGRACELLAVCDNAETHDQMHIALDQQIPFSHHVAINTCGQYRLKPFSFTANEVWICGHPTDAFDKRDLHVWWFSF